MQIFFKNVISYLHNKLIPDRRKKIETGNGARDSSNTLQRTLVHNFCVENVNFLNIKTTISTLKTKTIITNQLLMIRQSICDSSVK